MGSVPQLTEVIIASACAGEDLGYMPPVRTLPAGGCPLTVSLVSSDKCKVVISWGELHGGSSLGT